jgi:glutamine cyclotransferase
MSKALAHTKAVANGIAYDPDGGRLFVTGKNWPELSKTRMDAVVSVSAVPA